MPEVLTPKPTEAELTILQSLWRLGPSTVRAVNDDLNRFRRTGYTTVLKLLQIMTEKGLVERDTAKRAHVYYAKHSQEETQRQMLGDLLRRAFCGSVSKLVKQALAVGELSSDDMVEIRKVVETQASQN